MGLPIGAILAYIALIGLLFAARKRIARVAFGLVSKELRHAHYDFGETG